jgi:zinc transporter, ZIP family
MSTGHILLLGLIAGSTIFIGLPMGRLHDVGQSFKVFLSAMATGILLFLLWDVLSESITPVEDALNARDWGQFSGYAALAFGGFAFGLLSLVYYDAWMKRRRRKAFLGPGAASATELERSHFTGLTPPRWLALFIATGIGLHNFSEGLAIGQSAARDELSLALVLIIGFGLHNATEGFGIVAPLAGDRDPPSWRFLGALGVLGGGPTFVGTLIGQTWTSEALSVAFLALAAGSILYVVVELIAICRRFASKELVLAGILTGLVVGFATDFVLVAAGA